MRILPGYRRVLVGSGAACLAAGQRGGAVSLHGRPLGLLALHVAPGAKLLALSHDGGTPARVADWLTRHGYGESRMTALAHMGGPLETMHGRDAPTVGPPKFPISTRWLWQCIAGDGAHDILLRARPAGRFLRT